MAFAIVPMLKLCKLLLLLKFYAILALSIFNWRKKMLIQYFLKAVCNTKLQKSLSLTPNTKHFKNLLIYCNLRVKLTGNYNVEVTRLSRKCDGKMFYLINTRAGIVRV